MIRFFSEFAGTILLQPRLLKRAIVISLDTIFCLLSVWFGFYLRLGEFVSLDHSVIFAGIVSVVLAIPIFLISGLYRAIFRYSGLPAMMALVRAILLYGVLYAAIFTFYSVPGVPRTLGIIQPILLLVLVGASRASARVMLSDLHQKQIKLSSLPKAFIYGAGSAGRQLASAMYNSHEMRVIGFIDDDERLHGQFLNGLPIHDPSELSELLPENNITDVLLALPSISRARRNEILSSLSSHRVAVRTLPGLSDIATGRVKLSDVRELDIDDLLGRETVKPDEDLLNRNINNKIVLVTGAGGSIGSELCRQILKAFPLRILLVDISEFALYKIHQDLLNLLKSIESEHSDFYTKIEIIPLLASVTDQSRMSRIMSTWKPHTVYHAAAYKHVPLVEHNPSEGVFNNVWGTLVCAELSYQNCVENFVLISTDKAVRPTNIMGATKRLSEMVLQAFSDSHFNNPSMENIQNVKRTCFSMVRFGNVLGSSGSVVPLFRDQIKKGGPITLTHQDITRYFMTIPEAAQLVIQAGAMGEGGDVFVLNMGRPVKIYDLASRIVELSGLTVKDLEHPDGDIEILITGLRPGEKLYEELLIGNNPMSTQHSLIMKAQEDFITWNILQEKLQALKFAIYDNDILNIVILLKELVSGFVSNGNIVDWIYLASLKED